MNSGEEYCAGGGKGSEKGEPSLKGNRSTSLSSSSECDNQISPNYSLSGKNISGEVGKGRVKGEQVEAYIHQAPLDVAIIFSKLPSIWKQ